MNKTLNRPDINNDVAARRAFFTRLIREIGDALGAHCVVIGEYGSDARVCLDNTEPNYLWVTLDTYKHRLNFTGNLTVLCKHCRIEKSSYTYRVSGSDHYPRIICPKITVDCWKSAGKIAADIKRRLLPGYADALAQVREIAARYDANFLTTESAGAAFAALLSGGKFDPSTRTGSGGNDQLRVDFKTFDAGAHIEVKLCSLLPEQAAKLAAFLKTL